VCQVFSVEPPLTGGTGRKKPLTMEIRILRQLRPRDSSSSKVTNIRVQTGVITELVLRNPLFKQGT
jgi:hypothetical protein